MLGAKAAGIWAEDGVASRILAQEPLDWFGPLNPENAAFKPPMCLGKACPLPRVTGCQGHARKWFTLYVNIFRNAY